MSIVGRVASYDGDSFFLENGTRIKLTTNQIEGYKPIGIPPGKEPLNLVGEHVRFYIKKRKYKFVAGTEEMPVLKQGFVYGLIRLVVL
jgi:hypothetical protein